MSESFNRDTVAACDRTIVIYHNPKCSKSRETLALLRARGHEPRIVEYLKTPPSPAEVGRLLDRLGMTPRQLLRAKEAGAVGLNDPSLTDEQVIDGLSAHPQTMERPIVTVGDRAALGRPPEAVFALLDGGLKA